MAFDQFGRIVPDGTPGATPAPPTGAPPIGVGTYYSGDPSNPITQNPNAGFGSRSLAPNAPDQYVLNPNAVNGAPLSTAYAPPGTAAPTPAGPPAPANNTGTGTGLGTSPLAGQFSNANAFDPFGAGSPYDPLAVARGYVASRGISPNSGQQAVVADRASNLPLVYQILNGSAALDSRNSFTDFQDQYLAQGNGRGMSTADFFNAAFGSDTRDPIWQQLHGQPDGQGGFLPLKPADQVAAFYQLMKQGLANTVPPSILQSMESMYGQAGNDYMTAVSTGQYDGSFTDYLQAQGLGPGLFGG